MGYNSRSRHDSFDHLPPTQRKCKFWDATATLEIINPTKGCVTCVGFAPSRGRRCWNPINQGNRHSAFQLLEKLSYIDPSTTDINEMLDQLARLTLCLRYHQDQNRNIVQTWSKRISQQQNPMIKEESAAPNHIKTERLDEITFSSPMFQRYRKQSDPQSAQEERARKRREEEARKLKEQEQNRRQQERERKEREEKERKTCEQEKQRRKREEEKQRKKCEEEEQRKKCEKEEQRKREEDKQRKREQEARDREARQNEERNERIRQRAEQARKERERKAKEKAEKERKEWDDAWLRYVLGWDDIKSQFSSNSNLPLEYVC
jgi:hypothetical protein